MRALLSKIIVVLMLLVPATAYAEGLVDIEQHWAGSVLANLYSRQIITGDENQRFNPNKPVTRAEFVSMLVRGLKLEVETPASNETMFVDLPPEHWAFESVQLAYRNGLISGDDFGFFNPNAAITREEAAVIMARAEYREAVEQPVNTKVLTYTDKSKISSWARTGVALAVAKGIVNGTGNFNPGSVTTKAEAATMLYNYLGDIGTKRGIPVLMYHHIAPPGTYATPSGAVISTTQFEQQMSSLTKYGYTTITTAELYDYLVTGKALPKKPVLITFDDGYESNYVYAYPILKQHGHKAVINIVVADTPDTNQSDRGEAFDATYKTHLTWAQMQEMVASGLVEIQAHTYNSHGEVVINSKGKIGPALVNKMWLTERGRAETATEYRNRVKADLEQAKKTIEANLGTKVTTFCYPYGRFNEVTEDIAASLGYKMTLTTKPGYVKAEHTPTLLQRVKVGPEDTLADFLAKI